MTSYVSVNNKVCSKTQLHNNCGHEFWCHAGPSQSGPISCSWGSWRFCRISLQSCSSTGPSESPSSSQLEFGDSVGRPSSSSRLPVRPRGPTARRCSTTSRSRKLMYRRARRRISFLLSFLSGGCVGMRRRSSANAPFTFC